MSLQVFENGQRVRVLNSTIGGKLVLEGIATIKRVVSVDVDGYEALCDVEFDGDAGQIVRRFVVLDPDAMLTQAAPINLTQ